MQYYTFGRFPAEDYGSDLTRPIVNFTCPLSLKPVMEHFVDKIQRGEMLEPYVSWSDVLYSGEKVETLSYNPN